MCLQRHCVEGLLAWWYIFVDAPSYLTVLCDWLQLKLPTLQKAFKQSGFVFTFVPGICTSAAGDVAAGSYHQLSL